MKMRGYYLNLDYGQLHYRSNDARAATGHAFVWLLPESGLVKDCI